MPTGALDLRLTDMTGEPVSNISGTNPFLIRELLLSADPVGKSLDPHYQFRF
jgi:hypothetical protein